MTPENDAPRLPRLGLGASPLGGGMQAAYGYDVDAERARATLLRALDAGIRFIDTSNEYGRGASEQRIGAALAEVGVPGDVVIATKADPLPGSDDFSADRVERSFDESLERLGVDRVDVFHLHDPERFSFDELTGSGGAVEGMLRVKESGRARLIGVAGGELTEMDRYLATGVFDVVLNHNHFTLLDRSADGLIDRTVAAGKLFINAAPYASGILAKDAAAHARVSYREPSAAVLAEVARLREVCREFSVSLPAAALQFSLRDDRVSSTIVGVSHPDRVDELVRNSDAEIPEDFWSAIL